MNTPINILEYLAPMIKDKVFCDLGCGDYSFLKKAREYVKLVCGIQVDSRSDYLNVVMGNNMVHEWPEADIYYWFVFKEDLPVILRRHKKGILIIGGTPEKFKYYPPEVNQGIILDLPTKDHEEPIWRISIIKK